MAMAANSTSVSSDYLVLDGTSRDFSSAYKLIKDVVAPNLQEGDKNRLLIGINKSDKVMHHTFWESTTNQPKPELVTKLDEQSETVRKRIADDTGFSPDVIYYAAGETYGGKLLQEPYNLAKLLSFIIDHLPQKKRAAVVFDINRESGNFNSNDNKENYQEKIEKSLTESLMQILQNVFSQVREITLEVIQKSDAKELLVKSGVEFLKSIFTKK